MPRPVAATAVAARRRRRAVVPKSEPPGYGGGEASRLTASFSTPSDGLPSRREEDVVLSGGGEPARAAALFGVVSWPLNAGPAAEPAERAMTGSWTGRPSGPEPSVGAAGCVMPSRDIGPSVQG